MFPLEIYTVIASFSDIDTALNLYNTNKRVQHYFDNEELLYKAFGFSKTKRTNSFQRLVFKYSIYNLDKRCYKTQSLSQCIVWALQQSPIDKQFISKIMDKRGGEHCNVSDILVAAIKAPECCYLDWLNWSNTLPDNTFYWHLPNIFLALIESNKPLDEISRITKWFKKDIDTNRVGMVYVSDDEYPCFYSESMVEKLSENIGGEFYKHPYCIFHSWCTKEIMNAANYQYLNWIYYNVEKEGDLYALASAIAKSGQYEKISWYLTQEKLFMDGYLTDIVLNCSVEIMQRLINDGLLNIDFYNVDVDEVFSSAISNGESMFNYVYSLCPNYKLEVWHGYPLASESFENKLKLLCGNPINDFNINRNLRDMMWEAVLSSNISHIERLLNRGVTISTLRDIVYNLDIIHPYYLWVKPVLTPELLRYFASINLNFCRTQMMNKYMYCLPLLDTMMDLDCFFDINPLLDEHYDTEQFIKEWLETETHFILNYCRK
jgi:hypothetical protein